MLDEIRSAGIVPPPALQMGVINAFKKIPGADPTWPLWMFFDENTRDAVGQRLLLDNSEEALEKQRERAERREKEQQGTIAKIRMRERERSRLLEFIQANDMNNFLTRTEESFVGEDEEIDDVPDLEDHGPVSEDDFAPDPEFSKHEKEFKSHITAKYITKTEAQQRQNIEVRN